MLELYNLSIQRSENKAGIDITISNLCLDFTLPGNSEIDLCKNGSFKNVDGSNIEDYLSLIIDMYLGAGVFEQLESFKIGFNSVFPLSLLSCFSLSETVNLLGGDVDEDWSFSGLILFTKVIESCLKADHGYNIESKTVKNFIQMMTEFDKPTRRIFLEFITGCPRLPFGGFKMLSPKLTIVRKHVENGNVDDYLPSVMTCVNYLKVPDYSDFKKMKIRFDYAMNEGKNSFHLS